MTISYMYLFIFWPSERLESSKDQDKENTSSSHIYKQKNNFLGSLNN